MACDEGLPLCVYIYISWHLYPRKSGHLIACLDAYLAGQVNQVMIQGRLARPLRKIVKSKGPHLLLAASDLQFPVMMCHPAGL